MTLLYCINGVTNPIENHSCSIILPLLNIKYLRIVLSRVPSYNRALEITRCERRIETTLHTRRLLWAGTLIRMSGGRLPKRIVLRNLESAVRRGRGGKEKAWIDCIQSNIRAFGITGDWKATALKAEVWVTVTEGGRRFMAAWRKEEVDAARNRQEKRKATRLGKLLSHTEAQNFAKRYPSLA